ncbi:unnamed protein product [Symbiodinium natans]|uniref:Uncharacterized protein n=1 Tax=Symbiodinium natans TaxID=878477 RepID=A0A812J7H9_9DINO|nr:unnamed protein product [Symbiodinium natans]
MPTISRAICKFRSCVCEARWCAPRRLYTLFDTLLSCPLFVVGSMANWFAALLHACICLTFLAPFVQLRFSSAPTKAEFLFPSMGAPTSPLVRVLSLHPCPRCVQLSLREPLLGPVPLEGLLRLQHEVLAQRDFVHALTLALIRLTARVCASENLEGFLFWELGCI